MRTVNTLRLPGTALTLAVLLFSYSTSNAASTIDNPDGSYALHQDHEAVVQEIVQDAAPPARLYRTHDNGNYHRFHSNNAQLHSQPDNNRLKSRPDNDHFENRKDNRHGSRKIRHRADRYADGSDLHFRRYHHFPHDRHFGNHYYGRSDRRFFNTLVGGAILYRLFR